MTKEIPMMKIWIVGLMGTLLLISAATANAHGTACCQAKLCPAGQTAVPGDTPAAAKCCTDPANSQTCTASANAGWRCSDDIPGNAAAAPGRQAIAGCVDGENNTCIGGTITSGGPSGCIGVGGLTYVTSTSPAGGSAEQCTNDAVAACCARGACISTPAADEH
jgi:hypothetical protein